MSLLQSAYYDLKFENLFLQAKGEGFQEFFGKLMGMAYKSDFMASRPWGNWGDRKNDGFLRSERHLFQVYAPNEMKEAKAIAKIKADFEGAKVHWHTNFDHWTFVHNAATGLPPHVMKLILELEKTNPGIILEVWGLEKFWEIFRRLSPKDLSYWLGPAPTEETKARLGFEDLRVVLESLASETTPPDVPIKDVPPGKIEANDLSESVTALIKAGMTKAPLVSSFFDTWHDETLGERSVAAFRAEYERLRDTEMHPNRIFSELQRWAGGVRLDTADHQMAVLAVLAYYFERCDIFEAPRKAQPKGAQQ